MLDYKIKRITETPRGTDVVMAVYKGATTTENEEKLQDSGGVSLVPVTRYRRTQLLHTKVLQLPAGASRTTVVEKLNDELDIRAKIEKEDVHEKQRVNKK